MQDYSPVSPEARRRQPGRGLTLNRRVAFIAPGSYAREVSTRVAVGVMSDGFIHAGNLAYLSLVALFPFCIVAVAVARLFGRTGSGQRAVDLFLQSLPSDVAIVLKAPIADVVMAPSGSLLWFGAIVGLWTTASFVETIRDILRRAYGVESVRPFWQHRLWSIALVLASLILALIAFSFQVTLVAAEQFIVRTMPFAKDAAMIVSVSRLAPAIALFGALYLLFYTLTPRNYRESRAPKWPGALFTTAWWLGVTAMLPVLIARFANYDMIYGSLAGVMIALIFFFLVGWGLVVGAQLNAALAEADEQGVGSGNEADGTGIA
ncbi:MAG: ribonuclease BN [Sphingomonas sp.]|nr:ribonuclease BN [Sphingomonas sp.]